MHRIAATPGGWNPEAEGVIFVEQTPAPLVLLTAADTDIQTLAAALPKLPDGFPGLRIANLLQLQQQLTIDTYAETVLEQAQVIILRLLGGRSYWSYGLEVLQETVQKTGAALIVMPGDDALDPNLITHSTVSLKAVNQLWRYFTEGGVDNIVNAIKFVADLCLETSYSPPLPQPVPRVGIYSPLELQPQVTAKVGILFYRAHYIAGNTAPIDALCQALVQRQLEPVPIFISSLRDPDVQAELLPYFIPKDEAGIQLLLNTTSFSLARLETETPQLDLWQKLDVPVLQVIFSSSPVEQWESNFQGLSPRDIAMNVALPEVDGRIISRAVSFKAVQTWNPELETDVVVYEPISDRVAFVAELAANWVRLRSCPPKKRRVALILANYPCRDGRLANGVGLDTPASCVAILKALQAAGYAVENLPQTGDELIQRLTSGVTNDPEGWELRPVRQYLTGEEYQEYFAMLPEGVRLGIDGRWGFRETNRGGASRVGGFPDLRSHCVAGVPPVVASGVGLACAEDAEGRWGDEENSSSFPIAGIQLGNVFVGIQPARGYDVDPALNYHAPDLEPPHAYLAFYCWLRQHFGAQAVVHVGKHGNLEWLPGKGVALSASCYPEVALGPLPHLYPFIVNDPGEGSQAKRRTQAVIVDHLTPPMTRAELYGPLQQLEGLIDEYYEAQSLDPSRLPTICDRIAALVVQENFHRDLGFEKLGYTPDSYSVHDNFTEFLSRADGYLCELKEAQIRDGLHILGQCPQGRQLRDLIVAIARHPSTGHIGITRALAQALELDFDPLTADLSSPAPESKHEILKSCRTTGDVVEVLEQQAAQLIEQLLFPPRPWCLTPTRSAHASQTANTYGNAKSLTLRWGGSFPQSPPLLSELNWIRDHLLPALQQTNQEITQLLHGLDGRYIPSAPAGAPTRGRPEVLPTGRNFYSVDIRAIPTETAWDVGRKAAATLIELYTQEHGEYPKTLGLSVWGTSTMRTGGDDIAEALALIGVQPVWDGVSRRVVDFEIMPLSVLERPRVDVTLRISGFFRDAFPNLIDLFDRAVAAVAALDEQREQNPIAAQVAHETELWLQTGLTPQQAELRSRYRVFGSKPGAYGAGLQGLIEAQNWTDDQDLARAYINWSSYSATDGRAAPEAFEQRLLQMQIVLHNQDNREHDLLDSDDYYQFQGGLTAAVRSVRGQSPQTYFGDNSIPSNPRVRQLREEIARVYRSRVVNPKWIAGVMRHGYKGAFEMAATTDYLFAYDATARCVEDYMYQGVAETYLFDPVVQEFIQQKNPWALRDMAERLLEAHQRSLWQEADGEVLEKLRSIVHQAEAEIEGRGS
ncbi:MAG: cobaltochelatase subunit CobN [Chroococcidiopsidaceae cyanobacterium CP_BM_ER_R8_30]|nr:cobaltochelatase subunit CobN [Chroococcidiopsidaceae cyanobacterium CP_BM_ER_R8_30]